MRFSRGGIALAIVACFTAGGSFAACVSGDDSVVKDSGGDTTTQPDVVQQNDGGSDAPVGDGEAGLGPPPTPDGSVVWLNHYNNNVYPGEKAFADLAVNENGGLTYVVAGAFFAATATHYNFGNIQLNATTLYDPVSGGIGPTGNAVWATSPATSGGNNDAYQAVATDSSGNVYVYGYTQSASIKLKNTLTGPTSFVAKLTATGTPIWDHVYSQGTGAPLSAPAVLTLAGSNLVFASTYNGSLTYDTSTTIADDGTGSNNVFVTALDPATGTTKWAGSYGSPNNDSVTAIASTPQGNAILVGAMNGTMTGLSGSGMPLVQLGDAGTGTDMYVLEIDATGKASFGLVYGDMSSSATPLSVAYHAGSIAVAGQFGGNIDFGKGGVLASTGQDGIIFTIDESTKKTTFVDHLAGAASDWFTTVAFDPWGELVAGGIYGDSNASAQIGAQALPQTSIEVAGMVLAKWSATGTLLWSHGYVPTLNGGAPPYTAPDASDIRQTINPFRIQTTSTGQIVVAGSMVGGTNFGTGYQSQLSTYGYSRCTCAGKTCITSCFITNPPVCCNVVTPGFSADGIVGVWQP